jgi:hypothetical protein
VPSTPAGPELTELPAREPPEDPARFPVGAKDPVGAYDLAGEPARPPNTYPAIVALTQTRGSRRLEPARAVVR